jgi:hypothetical protein
VVRWAILLTLSCRLFTKVVEAKFKELFNKAVTWEFDVVVFIYGGVTGWTLTGKAGLTDLVATGQNYGIRVGIVAEVAFE